MIFSRSGRFWSEASEGCPVVFNNRMANLPSLPSAFAAEQVHDRFNLQPREVHRAKVLKSKHQKITYDPKSELGVYS